MIPRIGQLKDRVNISDPGASTDAMGQAILTFGLGTTRWAKVEEIAEPEQQVYDGTTAKRRIKVTLRSPYVGSKLWSAKMRLTYNAATFDVVSVRTLTANRVWVELIAETIE